MSVSLDEEHHENDAFISVNNSHRYGGDSTALGRTSSEDSVFNNTTISNLLQAEESSAFANKMFSVVYSRPYLFSFVFLFVGQLALMIYSLVFHTPFPSSLDPKSKDHYVEPLWLVITDIIIIVLTSLEVLCRIVAAGGLYRFLIYTQRSTTKCFNWLDVTISLISLASIAMYFIKFKYLYITAILMVMRNLFRLTRLISILWKHYHTAQIVTATTDTGIVDAIEVDNGKMLLIVDPKAAASTTATLTTAGNRNSSSSTAYHNKHLFDYSHQQKQALLSQPKEHVVVSRDVENHTHIDLLNQLHGPSDMEHGYHQQLQQENNFVSGPFVRHTSSTSSANNPNLSITVPRSYGSMFNSTAGSTHQGNNNNNNNSHNSNNGNFTPNSNTSLLHQNVSSNNLIHTHSSRHVPQVGMLDEFYDDLSEDGQHDDEHQHYHHQPQHTPSWGGQQHPDLSQSGSSINGRMLGGSTAGSVASGYSPQHGAMQQPQQMFINNPYSQMQQNQQKPHVGSFM